MKFRSMKFGIGRRISILIGLALLSSLVGFAVQLISLRTTLYEERQTALRHHAEAALSAVKTYAAQEAEGKLSIAEAQTRAREAVRSLRYGKGDYLAMYDMNGINVVHGGKPALEGKDMLGLQDPNGVRIIAELIDRARKGGGYVWFHFARPNDTTPQPKIAYALPFEPWNWLVASKPLHR